jgi:hypothetical protein
VRHGRFKHEPAPAHSAIRQAGIAYSTGISGAADSEIQTLVMSLRLRKPLITSAIKYCLLNNIILLLIFNIY